MRLPRLPYIERKDCGKPMRREVGAQLQVEVFDPTTLEFQIAVAPQPGAEVTEELSFTLNGNAIEPIELVGQHGTRIHKFEAGKGTVLANYSATIIGQADPAPVTEIDLSTYLRPSRYAEADKFYGFAATEFGKHAKSIGAAGEGVVLGGHAAAVRAGVQRSHRRRGRHRAGGHGCVP